MSAIMANGGREGGRVEEEERRTCWSSEAFRLAMLEAKAGAPVSPARMSAVPRALLFLGRRLWVLLASPLCNWSADVLRSGNGSDMMGERPVLRLRLRLRAWLVGSAEAQCKLRAEELGAARRRDRVATE